MSGKLISAKIDVVFKKFFIDNKDLLREFLADILEIPVNNIEEIIITNSEMPPESMESKFCRLDLNLKLKTKLINIEIQVNSESDYRDRTLFYWAKLYTSELKSGEPYGNLKQTIAINILNFNMFESKNYHTEVVAAIKETNEIFSDKFSIHFFELRKVGKKVNPNNRRELWIQFINADSEEEFKMLAETKVPTIEKAVKVILDMSEDTKIREMARQREKMLHDEASLIQGAKNEGIAIGEARGIEIGEARGETRGTEQTTLKSIRNLMDSLNVTDEKAMDILKLTEEEKLKYSKMLNK